MADRLPLVNIAGEGKELPSADTISQAKINGLVADLALKANLIGPTFTTLTTIGGGGGVVVDGHITKLIVADDTGDGATGIALRDSSGDSVHIGMESSELRMAVLGVRKLTLSTSRTTHTNALSVVNTGLHSIGDYRLPGVAWNGSTTFGKAGTDKVIVGYVDSAFAGAVIGAHNSTLNALAPLNLDGSELIFRTSEVERIKISSDGRVGLGTASPSSPLDIRGENADDNTGLFRIENENSGTGSDTNASFITKNTSGTFQLMQWQNFGARLGSRSISGSGIGDVILTVGNDAEAVRFKSDGKVNVKGDSVTIETSKTPASATATGTKGQLAWDAGYIYVCTATNTWKRSVIATW